MAEDEQPTKISIQAFAPVKLAVHIVVVKEEEGLCVKSSHPTLTQDIK